jgi:hypothetical protein
LKSTAQDFSSKARNRSEEGAYSMYVTDERATGDEALDEKDKP